MDLNDPTLRKAAVGKLQHGSKLAQSLRQDMDQWWAKNPVKVSTELRSDERTLDTVITTSPMPDVEDWYYRASDVLQNYRDALNRLAYGVSYSFLAPAKPKDVSFPIHRNEIGWQNWLKKRPELPQDVVERFRAFAPFVSGRPHLLALTTSNNVEKHELGFKLVARMTAFEMGGTTKVEGLYGDDKLAEQIKMTTGDSLDITEGRQVLATVIMPTKVLEFDPEGSGTRFSITPTILLEDEEVPLFAATEQIGLEVAWAIAHVTGIESDGKSQPKHINL